MEVIDVKHEELSTATPYAPSSRINADEELAHSLAEGVDLNYGLMQAEQTVVIRAYSDDADDAVLAEIRPRFIIMYEPSLEFVRRVEVCRFSLPLSHRN